MVLEPSELPNRTRPKLWVKKDRFSCVHRTLRQSPIFTVSFPRALYLSCTPLPLLGVGCGHGVCSLFGRLGR